MLSKVRRKDKYRGIAERWCAKHNLGGVWIDDIAKLLLRVGECGWRQGYNDGSEAEQRKPRRERYSPVDTEINLLNSRHRNL